MPDCAYVATDYHLDWVFASLFLAERGVDLNGEWGGPFLRIKDEISANEGQLDIDLLIAYSEGKKCHLLFLEAKGDSHFDNRQLNKKAERLRVIFKEHGCRWKGVNVKPPLLSFHPKNRRRN